MTTNYSALGVFDLPSVLMELQVAHSEVVVSTINLSRQVKLIRSSGTSVSNLETKAELNDSEQQSGLRQHDCSSAYERKTDMMTCIELVHTQAQRYLKRFASRFSC